MTRVSMVVPIADGINVSVDRELDVFRVHVGVLRLELAAGQLVVRTGPDGVGHVDLLRVNAGEPA